MAKTTLVDADVKAGADLLRTLDLLDLQIEAAMWLYGAELGEWTFLVATNLYTIQGPRRLYQQVWLALLQSEQRDRIPFEDIKAVGLNDPLVKALRQTVSSSGLEQARFTRSTIGGVYIEDAIVYRARPLRSRAPVASHAVAV
jgi:hypothetical protein